MDGGLAWKCVVEMEPRMQRQLENHGILKFDGGSNSEKILVKMLKVLEVAQEPPYDEMEEVITLVWKEERALYDGKEDVNPPTLIDCIARYPHLLKAQR
jgi:hypothetical protein